MSRLFITLWCPRARLFIEDQELLLHGIPNIALCEIVLDPPKCTRVQHQSC